MTASARGLFRATGKKSKPVAVRSAREIAGAYDKREHLERAVDDFYPTPPEPTRALLHYEATFLKRFKRVWEPAAGDGSMAKLIKQAGFDVVLSDIVDRGCDADLTDFFAYRHAPASAIITNPPYNLINERDGKGAWVPHAMKTLGVEYMALLLNWSWPGAGGLAKIWREHPPARVYLMRWKIDFTGQGAPPMLNGWFVWDIKHQGPTELGMMDRVDNRQSCIFSGAVA